MCSSSFAQKHDTLRVRATIYNSDTIPEVYLHQVNIIAPYTFSHTLKKRQFEQLKRDVIIIYPYAKKASAILKEIDAELASKNKRRDKKKFIRNKEEELNSQFKNTLKNMYTSQGKLLILLIDRETGKSCYEIIKGMKGGMTAFVYNSMMSIYDDNLNMKRRYSKEENEAIETIIFGIEHGFYPTLKL